MLPVLPRTGARASVNADGLGASAHTIDFETAGVGLHTVKLQVHFVGLSFGFAKSLVTFKNQPNPL